jgi:hypothetical protein
LLEHLQAMGQLDGQAAPLELGEILGTTDPKPS